jgi:hypothetical protein
VDLEEALLYLNNAINAGEPRSVQGQAWFDRGEIQSLLGDCSGALDSFNQVKFYESSSSPMVTRAERRILDIQVGRGLVELRGRCG